MPMYDCICQDCGKQQERVMSREAWQTPCVKCGGVAVRREIQVPAARRDRTWDL